MRVTVVIPVFNEEKYIENCLECLHNQKVKADEIIVVDNNSTDRTLEIARRFDIRILHEEQQGCIPARNRGFDHASCEIIARCDADSRAPSGWIRRIKHDFQRNAVQAVSGPAYFYDFPILGRRTIYHEILLFKISRLIGRRNVLLGSNMAITKSCWLRIRDSLCSNESLIHEDMDIALHIHPAQSIFYDRHLVCGISSRRIRERPFSFVEYWFRWGRTLAIHWPFLQKETK